MSISTFSILVSENLTPNSLKNCIVVIDGQNFLYKLYEKSGLQYKYGCESDKYADYVRNYLDMFKKADVDCYFIFKGGHKNKNVMLDKYIQKSDKFKPPIFMKDIYKEVLDEMGFNYTICEFESKKESVAFAQRNNCPVISEDTSYCFSSIAYIPSTSLNFNEETGSIDCGVFNIKNFMQKYKLTKETLAMFRAVTSDRYECIPKNRLPKFLNAIGISAKGLYDRNLELLKWLGNSNKKHCEQEILRFTTQGKFKVAMKNVQEWIGKWKPSWIPTKYLEDGNNIEITEKDPEWFAKGVASKHIAIPLVNLYRHETVFGSPSPVKTDNEDAMLLSMDIIKYIYNLLTNFKKKEITFYYGKEGKEDKVILADSIPKPDYNEIINVFENGWLGLTPGLFQHFLSQTLKSFNIEELENLPQDSKLLMITLTYFSHKKAPVDVKNEVYCVLLCYAVLSAKDDEKSSSMESLEKHFKRDISVKFLHPLEQLQHCLEYMNYLNKLCGEPFKPTLYNKTYNGTFVYKMLRAMKTASDNMEFMKELKTDLAPVSDVLKTFQRHINVYHNIKNVC